jgi:hypothetical protein
LHQNRFPDRNLYDIADIAFLGVASAVVSPVAMIAALVVAAVVVVVRTADYYPSIQDSYVVVRCLRLMVSFCLFSG